MDTTAKGNTRTNFYRHFEWYLRYKYDLEAPQAYQALDDIRADQYDGQDELVLRYRNLLPAKSQLGKREDYPKLILPLIYMFLKYFEEIRQITGENTNVTKRVQWTIIRGGYLLGEPRVFSLLPMKHGFRCSHLKIRDIGFYELLKKSHIHDLPSDEATFLTMANIYWRHFFNIEDYETEYRKFACEILTDGKAVNVVLRVKNSITAITGHACKPESVDLDKIKGLDPGRHQLCVANNDRGDIKNDSTKQFCPQDDSEISCKKIDTWQNIEDQVSEVISRVPCMKTASVDRFKIYMEYLLPRLDILLNFHINKDYHD